VEKGLAFNFEVQGDVPRQIRTDPLKLRQVLLNLLGNAVKFTQRGEVRLRVQFERYEAGGTMRFDVSDTGIGIDPGQIKRLFQPFSQADDSMTRRFGGTGLGLAITKRLTMLLGGDVAVESKAGAGSVFTVRIDAGPYDGIEMIHGLTEALLPKPTTAPVLLTNWSIHGRILLVEDGVDNQRLISMHLRKAGANVMVAENGRVGVNKTLDAAKAGHPFDLLLMDMQMPELDGYGAASELRARGITVPIIALTAHAMADDRDKCLAAGCSDYLTKPVEKAVLLRVVAEHLRQAPPQHSIAQAAQKPEEILRSGFAYDPDLKEVLAQFIEKLPHQVAKLSALLRDGNLDDLRRAVHQLKGAGGGYGFPEITETAAVAEQRIRAADSIDAIALKVDALIQTIRRVEGYNAAREPGRASEVNAPDPTSGEHSNLAHPG
jgi:CheY-like chemotaxis protein/anti-sigma regulatory factor (Ser/Thr protein kinase)